MLEMPQMYDPLRPPTGRPFRIGNGKRPCDRWRATPGWSAIRKLPGACRPSGLACESVEDFVTCS